MPSSNLGIKSIVSSHLLAVGFVHHASEIKITTSIAVRNRKPDNYPEIFDLRLCHGKEGNPIITQRIDNHMQLGPSRAWQASELRQAPGTVSWKVTFLSDCLA
jgi:hypothetical protein